jgi:hypothetical protein
VSGQKLCKILTPALFAAQGFLSFQNKKFIRLTAFLTTVFINRHIFSFTLTDEHPAYLCSNLFVLLEARFSARIHPDELDTHRVQKAPQAYFDLITQDFP